MIYQDDANGISIIDTGYLQEKTAAAYLIVEQGHAVFIDTGTNIALPHLLDSLVAKNIAVEQVDYVILTHIHLDHAGGAGQLMQTLPNAQLVVHPRGMSHIVDPSRLIEGVKAVYGEVPFKRLYGDIIGIDADRVIQAMDQTVIDFQGRDLLCIDTPGHAQHHICIWDSRSQSMFAGDTFGVSYPEFHREQYPFIFPTTTPVQFDPGALHASIKRLLSFEPQQIYLTHYGAIRHNIADAADELHTLIDAFVALVREVNDADNRQLALETQMQRLLLQRLQDKNYLLTEQSSAKRLANDIKLNSQGLLGWWDKTQAVYG